MKRAALRRKTTLRRTAIGKVHARREQRCPGCHCRELVLGHGLVAPIAVAPGCVYQVITAAARLCACCGMVVLSLAQRRAADADAYAQHRQVILERDGWRCRRCGRGGPGSGVTVEVAHTIGFSRARNPGPTKHAPVHLEVCCLDCHRAEHSSGGASRSGGANGR